MGATLEISGKTIGAGHPCFLIAEAGVNHDGDVRQALRLIDVAVDAGVDAIKFQTFRAETLASVNAPLAQYQRGHETWRTQREMLRRLELTETDYRELFAYCRERRVLFLSSPFDEASADLLEGLGVAAFKIPSGEITNLPLLRHLARKRKPLIVSTGMAHLGEVDTAVTALHEEGAHALSLLHCVSRYPAEASEANLRAMATLANAFGCPVGFSDHTLGIEVALAAVTLGASLLEKHITLDRGLPGPDHSTSLEPEDLKAMVRAIRRVESALGHGRKEPVEGEAEIASVARKSLVAARELPQGKTLDATDIVVLRPGTGLSPAVLPLVLGRRLRRALQEGDLLRLDDLES